MQSVGLCDERGEKVNNDRILHVTRIGDERGDALRITHYASGATHTFVSMEHAVRLGVVHLLHTDIPVVAGVAQRSTLPERGSG